MLKKFQVILQRDSLKEDLDSKFMVIFHNYGLDLETVQEAKEDLDQHLSEVVVPTAKEDWLVADRVAKVELKVVAAIQTDLPTNQKPTKAVKRTT